MVKRRERRAKVEYTGNETQIVTFKLGDEIFGVRVNDIREIVKPENVTRVPQMPGFIEGVMNLRGQITTIINLNRLMEIEGGSGLTAQSRIIVAEVGGNQLGLIVDSVHDVMRISPDSISDPPKMVTSQKSAQFLVGICKLPDKLILLIDLALVFTNEELEEVFKTGTTTVKGAPSNRTGMKDGR
jgi:purine-binding chemotaxis protein CheW